MWSFAVRQLTRYTGNQQELDHVGKLVKVNRAALESGFWLKHNSRYKSSAAGAGAGAEAAAVLPACGDVAGLERVGVGWELRACAAPPFGASAALPSYSASNPLEESVTALDAALHRAVHLPWVSNHLWWMQWLLDSKGDGLELSSSLRGSTCHKGFRHTVGVTNFGSSAAAAVVEEESPDDGKYYEEERKREKREVQSKRRLHRLELHDRQMKIESEAWKNACHEYKELLLDMCKKNLAPSLPFVQSLVLGWFEPFRNAIEAEQNAVRNLEFKESRAGYGPFLMQLPADMLAVITMHKLMGILMSDWTSNSSVKVVTAASLIGDAVETEVGIYRIMRKKRKKKQTGEPEYAVKRLQEKLKTQMKKRQLRMVKSMVMHASSDEPWTSETKAKVGCVLIELLLDTAFLQAPASQTGEDQGEMRPAFKHTAKTYPGAGAGRSFGVIECDPLIVEQLDKSAKFVAMPYMPMLVKPKLWRGYNVGGYLVLPSNVMRIHGARQQREAIDKSSAKMNRVYDALNTLGSVRWRINSRVLDVVETLWKDGGAVAQLVDAVDVPIPEKPVTGSETRLTKWKWEVMKAKRINSERHSQRCDTELKLEVARKLRGEEAFYYPHNLDFRGRAYPLHPHLNHLGSDLCRGLLEFANGCPLGENGLRWLKIHLANVYAGGVDKLSFDGRAAFVDMNFDEVLDSAERPLEGRRWWLKAEDPFQCLAACISIRDATLSDNIEKFVSYLPVHQDGSCNGLQHYAALGRDQDGARSVNLTAGEKPADVYSGIAARVRAVIEKDAADNPVTNFNADKAKLLVGQIDRKLVKQTVMTSVYGVTFIGARNQIMNRLKERGLEDEQLMFRATCYAAKITIDALGQMFKEARCIMNWLGDCAKIIAGEGEPVRWTTPLGLPVVQPYRKPGRKLIKTSLQVLALRENNNQPVATSRQRSAFPPNFVHSLDGSHMMMTALNCKKLHLSFAGVHDSFWTHAGSVEKMNHILRRTFVELYSKPILEDLLKDFQTQFPHLTFPDVPKRGDLDLSEVLQSPYFFN